MEFCLEYSCTDLSKKLQVFPHVSEKEKMTFQGIVQSVRLLLLPVGKGIIKTINCYTLLGVRMIILNMQAC